MPTILQPLAQRNPRSPESSEPSEKGYTSSSSRGEEEEDLPVHPQEDKEEVEGLTHNLSQSLTLDPRPHSRTNSAPSDLSPPRSPTMSSASQNQEESQITHTSKPTELHLGQPEIYDGTPTKAMTWLNSVQIYLIVNREIYNTDEKRITFTLSFMKKGSAQTWATTFIRDTMDKAKETENDQPFGTFLDFTTKFKESFIHSDLKGEAIAWLSNTIVSKNLPLGDYISQFRNYASLSEITNDDALINFFNQGIPTSLMKRIYSMDTVPTTIEEWYKQAIHFKKAWDKADAIEKRKPTYSHFYHNNKSNQNQNQYPHTPAKDPNAISIKKLTPQDA